MPLQNTPVEPFTQQTNQIIHLIDMLSKKLMARHHMLGTAESCTGGLLAALCTDMPGSSAWFKGSVVAYANEIKENLLSVPALTLEHHGAVSQETVVAMAQGALQTLDVTLAIAVSGIAGPAGGTAEKPVGTVWIAVASQTATGITTTSKCFLFSGNRTEVRLKAAEQAFALALE